MAGAAVGASLVLGPQEPYRWVAWVGLRCAAAAAVALPAVAAVGTVAAVASALTLAQPLNNKRSGVLGCLACTHVSVVALLPYAVGALVCLSSGIPWPRCESEVEVEMVAVLP